MAKRDLADEVAEAVKEWIESTADYVSEAILGSALAPAVVQPTRAEALAYYRAKLYLPDGTPNPVGRDELLARLGPQGYESVALALAGEPTELPSVPSPVEVY